MRRGLYVDCETTGLDGKRDDIIEVGMLPFTDGALSTDRERGLTAPRRGSLFPTAALSKVFRGKHLDALTAAHRTGALHMPGEQDLEDSRAFESLKTALQSNPWVVYSKAPFAGAAHVLASLGRYTHARHRHPNAPWALPTDTPAKPGPDCRADENEPALSLSAAARRGVCTRAPRPPAPPGVSPGMRGEMRRPDVPSIRAPRLPDEPGATTTGASPHE